MHLRNSAIMLVFGLVLGAALLPAQTPSASTGAGKLRVGAARVATFRIAMQTDGSHQTYTAESIRRRAPERRL